MAESMKGLKRTCRCAEVSREQIGSRVTLMGWVQKARNRAVSCLWIYGTVPALCS